MSTPPNAVMTVKEVAEYLQVSESTVYKLVREKKIPARKVGGGWRFPLKSVDAWLHGQDWELAS